jgi:PqqD family protein of HPr-rel-A system
MSALADKQSDLDIHVVDDGYVVYHQAANRVHYLNPAAALVLELCDGTRTDDEIVTAVHDWFESSPAISVTDVGQCLAELRAERLVH